MPVGVRATSLFTEKALENGLFGIGVEEVYLVGINLQVDFLANMHLRARIETGLEGFIGVATTGQVDEQFVTQVLNYVDGSFDDRVALAILAGQGAIFQMLRADAEGQVTTSSLASQRGVSGGYVDCSHAFQGNHGRIALTNYLRALEKVHGG